MSHRYASRPLVMFLKARRHPKWLWSSLVVVPTLRYCCVWSESVIKSAPFFSLKTLKTSITFSKSVRIGIGKKSLIRFESRVLLPDHWTIVISAQKQPALLSHLGCLGGSSSTPSCRLNSLSTNPDSVNAFWYFYRSTSSVSKQSPNLSYSP